MTVPGARRYLIDNSAWARAPYEPVVRDQIVHVSRQYDVVVATPQVLEAGFSAWSPDEWDAITTQLGNLDALAMSARTHDIALEVQRALWHGGKIRAAGVFDTLLAAIATEHEVVVLHSDSDYEHISAVDPRLRQEWVAPRGSL